MVYYFGAITDSSYSSKQKYIKFSRICIIIIYFIVNEKNIDWENCENKLCDITIGGSSYLESIGYTHCVGDKQIIASGNDDIIEKAALCTLSPELSVMPDLIFNNPLKKHEGIICEGCESYDNITKYIKYENPTTYDNNDITNGILKSCVYYYINSIYFIVNHHMLLKKLKY